MISKWNYLPLTSNEQQIARTLGDRYPKVPALCKLLAQRGVTSAAEAEKFFKPQLSDLHDPFLMRDMEKAVVRLNRALGSKEKIMIYGDYDVDGTTAVSLVYKFLQNYYSGLDYYIPDRYFRQKYRLCRRKRYYAVHRSRLRYQSRRKNSLRQKQRDRFYHLRPPHAR